MIKVYKKDTTSYELLYNTGGHGGPYTGLDNAIEAARKLMYGCRSLTTTYIIPTDKELNISNGVYSLRKTERDGETHLIHNVLTYKSMIKEVNRGPYGIVPGQGANGYGSKISTDYMIEFNGATYRVYCICYSNVGSLYIKRRGEMVFVNELDLKHFLPSGEAC